MDTELTIQNHQLVLSKFAESKTMTQENKLHVLDDLYEATNKLDSIEKGKEGIFKSFKEILKKNKEHLLQNKIRVPVLGLPQTGKTSVINSLIGKKILPVNKRSSNLIVIQYCNGESSKLYKATFNGENFQYNESQPLVARNDKISKFLEKEENSVFLLKTKIHFFEEISMDEEQKYLLEFIDFPSSSISSQWNTLVQKIINSANFFLYTISLSKSTYEKTLFINNITKFEKLFNFSYFPSQKCIFLFNKIGKISDKSIKKFKTFQGALEKQNLSVHLFSSENYMALIKLQRKYFSQKKRFFESLLASYVEEASDFDIFSTPDKGFFGYCIEKIKKDIKKFGIKKEKVEVPIDKTGGIIKIFTEFMQRNFNDIPRKTFLCSEEKARKLLKYIYIVRDGIPFSKFSRSTSINEFSLTFRNFATKAQNNLKKNNDKMVFQRIDEMNHIFNMVEIILKRTDEEKVIEKEELEKNLSSIFEEYQYNLSCFTEKFKSEAIQKIDKVMKENNVEGLNNELYEMLKQYIEAVMNLNEEAKQKLKARIDDSDNQILTMYYSSISDPGNEKIASSFYDTPKIELEIGSNPIVVFQGSIFQPLVAMRFDPDCNISYSKKVLKNNINLAKFKSTVVNNIKILYELIESKIAKTKILLCENFSFLVEELNGKYINIKNNIVEFNQVYNGYKYVCRNYL